MIKQAVILAGGRGERLKPFTDKNPKPLYPIQNRPFIYYLIDQLLDYGIGRVVFLLGYLADNLKSAIHEYDRYEECEFIYQTTPVNYDTGARLVAANNILENEFLLLYCDNYSPINLEKAYQEFHKNDYDIQISAYANKDGYTRNNIRTRDGLVIVYDKKRIDHDLNAVDIGYAFVKKQTLGLLKDDNANFEAEVYPIVADNGKMGCYVTNHRYYSIGSWERMKLTEELFRDRKVVFLDRDGTLNVRPPKAEYITRVEDFIWLKGAKESIKYLKDHGYEVYIISNQPGIARGMLTVEILEKIHDKMRIDLRDIGTDIDGIYYCPHGWDDGCNCRKPKPGMLFQAQREHSLNLTKCILIGDDQRDIDAGNAAELKKCMLVSDKYTLWDAVHELG